MQRTPTGPVGTAMIRPTNMPFNKKPGSIRRPTLAKPAAVSGKRLVRATEMRPLGAGAPSLGHLPPRAGGLVSAGDAEPGYQAAGVLLPRLRPAGRQPL